MQNQGISCMHDLQQIQNKNEKGENKDKGGLWKT